MKYFCLKIRKWCSYVRGDMVSVIPPTSMLFSNRLSSFSHGEYTSLIVNERVLRSMSSCVGVFSIHMALVVHIILTFRPIAPG